MTVTQVIAYAKVNLVLAVGRVRPDGYHELGNVFHAVNLAEHVRVEQADADSLQFTGPVDAGSLSTGPENLVWRAADTVAELAGGRPQLRVVVGKHVPIQGGMAGGSADAAATLRAVNRLLGHPLSTRHLHEAAARLGADVPFALDGGSAVGFGRGDVLTRLPHPQLWWVLVFSVRGLSTPEVFRSYDELMAERSGGAPAESQPVTVDIDLGAVEQALTSAEPARVASILRNDLTHAAYGLQPRLAQVYDDGMRAGALAGVVCGSGPTYAFLAASEWDARELATRMQDRSYQAIVVSSAPAPYADR